MKRFLLTLVLGLLPLLAGGCAGQQADLLSYDNIIAANTEAAKGVRALETGLLGDVEKQKTQLFADVATWVVESHRTATQPGEVAADAAEIASRVRTHVTNLSEQERRIRVTTETTLDNLLYAQEVAEKAKRFVIYRANVADQFRQYLEAVTPKATINPTATP